jgi:2-(1,2-epoxy-1,2-dihydrophenyl)acetyl-CoA isomerase
VADTAGFNLAFANVALSCDTGASYHLQRLVGRAKALELLYFPSTIPAADALELGLATKVVDDDAFTSEVTALATKLAAGPTLSYASIRQSVNYSSSHDFADSLAFEAAKMNFTGASSDHRRAVDAFLAKERASFEGR